MLGVLLTGCMSGTSYAVLDREAEAADALPGAVETELLEPETARFVGEDDGASLWLVRGVEASTICLVAYRTDDAWVSGCSGEGGGLAVRGEVGSWEVAPDGAPAPAGTRKLFDNIFIPER